MLPFAFVADVLYAVLTLLELELLVHHVDLTCTELRYTDLDHESLDLEEARVDVDIVEDPFDLDRHIHYSNLLHYTCTHLDEQCHTRVRDDGVEIVAPQHSVDCDYAPSAFI